MVFCDLCGFIVFIEVIELEEVMNVLCEYYVVFGELIFKYEGMLDKYVGDGVMILFNVLI